MNADNIITAGLGVLAGLQIAWCLIYGTGPWRETRLGWVWLFKGSMLAVIWTLLFVDQFHDIADAVWAVIAIAQIVATASWLWATIRVRFGHLS